MSMKLLPGKMYQLRSRVWAYPKTDASGNLKGDAVYTSLSPSARITAIVQYARGKRGGLDKTRALVQLSDLRAPVLWAWINADQAEEIGRNPAKSPRRVSQITGKPPSKRLRARRAKKHVPGYFPNPRHSARTPQYFYWYKADGSVSRAFVTKRAAESQARIYAKNSGKTVALIRGTQREYLDIVAPESRAARYDA